MKKNSDNYLLLCSDMHLRKTQPECRLDDFVYKTQWQKLDFLNRLQQKYGCDILHGGDLFEHWDTPAWLLTKTIQHLPDNFYTVYGQHDLPNHNYEYRHKSGVSTLAESGVLNILPQGHWGQKIDMDTTSVTINGKRVLVLHRFVWDGLNVPWPGCNHSTADELLDEFSGYDLIVTGDHHKGFVNKRKDQMLVNPGCFSRQDGGYKDYQPGVYLYNTETGEVEKIKIPIIVENVSKEHLHERAQKEEQIEKHISNLRQQWAEHFGSLSEDPKKMLNQYLENHKIKQIIQEIIYESLNI